MTFKHLRKQAYCMGTLIDLQVISNKATVDINNILETGINIIQQIKSRYSRFDKHSELSQLNNSTGYFQCQDREIVNLIKFGIELYKKTDGYFDISIADFLELYGYGRKIDISTTNIDLSKEITEILKTRPKLTDIQIDQKLLKIKLQPNQKLDLGSYIKGFAIKKIKEFFLRSNIDNFLINAGGDIYANGTKQSYKPWIVGLFDSSTNSSSTKLIKKIPLLNESIACSGKWARKIKSFNHLINPLTGGCIDNNDVFVKSRDPMIADAFATICYIKPEFANLSNEYNFTVID